MTDAPTCSNPAKHPSYGRCSNPVVISIDVSVPNDDGTDLARYCYHACVAHRTEVAELADRTADHLGPLVFIETGSVELPTDERTVDAAAALVGAFVLLGLTYWAGPTVVGWLRSAHQLLSN